MKRYLIAFMLGLSCLCLTVSSCKEKTEEPAPIVQEEPMPPAEEETSGIAEEETAGIAEEETAPMAEEEEMEPPVEDSSRIGE